MRKILIIILCIAIAIPVCTISAEKISGLKNVTYNEALHFAEDVKEMTSKNYDSANRLIVSSGNKINTMNAVDVVTGFGNIYVLQYDSKKSADEAYDYYNTLSGINYVEYDVEENVSLCEDADDFDFKAKCASTNINNIDDAIKLMHEQNVQMPEITVGIVDSGIALNEITESRFDGGHTALPDYAQNGTQDSYGHGTRVAGTLINNTPDNVRLRSYQILNENGKTNSSSVYSQLVLAVTEGCRVLNCSFTTFGMKEMLEEIVDYANEQNIIIVCAAGNQGRELTSFTPYPACFDDVITVGGNTNYNTIWSSSNYGKVVDIYTTGTALTALAMNGDMTGLWNGTSASTPVACAICTLLISIEPDITRSEIEYILQLTGRVPYEENCTDTQRLIADAYECVKYLLNAELEHCQLDYTVQENSETAFSNISFTSEENASVYYCIVNKNDIYYPYEINDLYNEYLYNGSQIELDECCAVTAYAYAPHKAKSELAFFSAPNYDTESGYQLSVSSDEQTYNSISYCSITDEKDITVPRLIDGTEIQEIGTYCFMGNQNVETIILPYSVKKIGNFAFANCPNLKTVIAPGVTECGMFAFYNCKNLETAAIPNLKTANTALFKNCQSLRDLQCQPLTVICNQAFYKCAELKSISVENNTFSFCNNTFYGCDNLTLCAPENSYMYNYALENDIQVVTQEDENQQSCTHTDFEILESIERGCCNDGYTVYVCLNCKYVYTAYYYKTGHNYSATHVNATCSSYEHIDYLCLNCSDTYTEVIGIILLPHDTYTVDYLAPTEDHTGRAYTYCRNCDTVLPDTVIPSLAPYSVTGKIVAAEDKDMHAPHQYPVAGACITVNDELVAVTDENGEFVANFNNGTYTAYVTYSNGLDTSFTFTVENASTEIESAVPIVACDWHKDGYINAKDYAKLKNAKDISGFDLNGDNVLNEVEENIFRNFITSE